MYNAVAVNKSKSKFDVYIGRGSKWGNPFKMKNYSLAERNRVCDEYEKYFFKSGLYKSIPELVDKKLGCFCKPLRCHGDFLAQCANEYELFGVMFYVYNSKSYVFSPTKGCYLSEK